MELFERIKHGEELLAVIIRNDYKSSGVEFFTPNEFSQQLASMGHAKGKVIEPHVHNSVLRQVQFTKEVLVIKSGRLRVDFYDDDKKYLESRILNTGDVILLANGGHGFEVLEDLQMIEIKQGPYTGENDKSRFDQIEAHKIQVKD